MLRICIIIALIGLLWLFLDNPNFREESLQKWESFQIEQEENTKNRLVEEGKVLATPVPVPTP